MQNIILRRGSKDEAISNSSQNAVRGSPAPPSPGEDKQLHFFTDTHSECATVPSSVQGEEEEYEAEERIRSFRQNHGRTMMSMVDLDSDAHSKREDDGTTPPLLIVIQTYRSHISMQT